MAVKSKEELIESLKAVLGEEADDNSLALLEDVADTFDANQLDWKQKYDDLDRDWRKRYRDRFFDDTDDGEIFQREEEVKPKLTYADLFSTK